MAQCYIKLLIVLFKVEVKGRVYVVYAVSMVSFSCVIDYSLSF